MISRADPDDPWFRLQRLINERRATHTNAVMGGELSERQYWATSARHDELAEVLKLIQVVRRNEDITPRQPDETVADRYDA